MQRILSTELPAHIGETVHIAGWVHRRRLLKSVAFLIVRDAAGLTQVVVTDRRDRAQVEALTEETVVEVTATATRERRGARRGRAHLAAGTRARQRRRTAAVRAASADADRDACPPSSTMRRGAAAPATRRGPADLGGRGRRVPGGARRAAVRRGAHPEDRRLGDRVGGQRVRRSTSSAGPPTWRSRRSSTSR